MELMANEESEIVDELFHTLAKYRMISDILEVPHHLPTRREVDALEQVMGSVTSESCACDSCGLYVLLRQFE